MAADVRGGDGQAAIVLLATPEEPPRAGDQFSIEVGVRPSEGRKRADGTLHIVSPDGAMQHVAVSAERITIALQAPARAGQFVWRIKLAAASETTQSDPPCLIFETAVAPQIASLAVWGIPDNAVRGATFKLIAGASSTSGKMLSGATLEVIDTEGRVAGRSTLGGEAWPGTSALGWAEIEVTAPDRAGVAEWRVSLSTQGIWPEHEAKPILFTLAVSEPPRHALEVTLVDAAVGVPLADALMRGGAVRATTGADGRATLMLPEGTVELSGWLTGYDVPTLSIEAGAAAALIIQATRLPEEDPDDHWKA